MDKKKKAFTLVELFISILIIAVLLLILFNSFLGYIITSRDTSRIVEFGNINTAMNNYMNISGYFPTPTNSINIVHSGVTVWTQGTFGNEISNLLGCSPNIVDPLTKKEYTYSIKNSRKEYSLAGVLENSKFIGYDNLIIPDVHAEEYGIKEGIAFVSGNYNGELLSINTGSIDYILAVPSIVSSDLSSSDLTYIIDNNKFVYNNYKNLPASYSGSKYNVDADIDFSANNLIVYTGSITDMNHSDNRVRLLQNVYNAYSGSLIGNKISVNKINREELFAAEPSNTIKSLACDLVNFKLKYLEECK